MPNVSEVVKAAERHSTKDEAALEVLAGMVDKELEKNPAAREIAYLEPKYDGKTMGALDDLKALGRKILMRWNKELHALVCGDKPTDAKERQEILKALNLGEAAVIASVAAALLPMGVPAPLAAVLAPLIVKKFIWPAKDELCAAWGEAITRGK